MSPADDNNDPQPRSATAVVKRADQLKRWLESETNKEETNPKDKKQRVIFDQRVCFLAACAAGDFEEINKLLSRELVDINVCQEDGMTALHQACIDDRLDMVKFLVDRNADINRGDNEGWTVLHATASCGYIDIARYLIDHGARVDIVNNDGELPIDIADTDEMENLLQTEIYKQGIDISFARSEEEQIMLKDVKSWFEGSSMRETVHPKTKATSLHVASAKGYLEVMRMLLELGVDINARDVDGWTPLHAAAHWGQRESCKTLVECGCDMDIKTSMGQTVLDVCDPDLINFLEDLQKRQPTLVKEKSAQESQQRRQPLKRRISANKNVAADRTADAKAREAAFERAQLEKHTSPLSEHNVMMETSRSAQTSALTTAQSPYGSARPQIQVKAYTQEEVKPSSTSVKPISFLQTSPAAEQQRVSSPTASAFTSKGPEKPISFLPPADNKPISFLQPREPVPIASPRISPSTTPTITEKPKEIPVLAQKVAPISFLNRDDRATTATQPSWLQKSAAATPVATPSPVIEQAPLAAALASKVVLPDLPSFDYIDETTPQQSPSADSSRPQEGRVPRRIVPDWPPQPSINVECAKLLTHTQPIPCRKLSAEAASPIAPISKRPSTTTSSNTFFGVAAESPSAGGDTKESTVTVRRSFQPPNRDEESEAQRKAHAKRVRETRRSTQGVSAEDLKAADAQVKQFPIPSISSAQPASPPSHDESEKENEAKNTPARLNLCAVPSVKPKLSENSPSKALTNQPSDPEPVNLTIPARKSKTDEEGDDRKDVSRRRVRKRRSTGVVNMDMDEEEGSASGTDFVEPQAEPTPAISNGQSSQKSNGLMSYSGGRRGSAGYGSSSTKPYQSQSTSSYMVPASALSSLLYRSSAGPTPTPTQAAYLNHSNASSSASSPASSSKSSLGLQSRNSSRSRSIHAASSTPADRSYGRSRYEIEADRPATATATSYSSTPSYRTSRASSVSSASSAFSEKAESENTEHDWKKMYEKEKAENDKLRKKLQSVEKDLDDVKATSSGRNAVSSVASEAEKRERRALERKMAEMEEELKELEQLRADNQRLKEENGALIRVISKLSK